MRKIQPVGGTNLTKKNSEKRLEIEEISMNLAWTT